VARNQDEVPDNDEHIGLSAEEIAALEADDDATGALQSIVDEDDDTPPIDTDDDDDLDDDDDPDAKAAAAAAAADAAKDKPAVVEPGDDEPEEPAGEDEPEFQSSYRVDFVENFDGQMAEFSEQKKALREQLNNGDIDMDAYEEGKDAIVAKEQALSQQQLKAEIAAEQNEQNAQARWKWEQERFFGDKSNTIYTDKYVMGMLDMAVKDLAQQPENAQRSAPWFLQEADRLVRERIGKPRDAKEPAPLKEEKPSRKPDLSKIPKTIGNLPSAELPETGEEEFAHLDSLSGMKLEAAIAKLSPAQLSRYLGAPEE